MTGLTSLANVKQYLAINTTNSDALIAQLISRESRHIQNWLERRLPSIVNVDTRLNGTGCGMLMLPDQPVISVQSLTMSGANVPAAPADGTGWGYRFDDTTLYLTEGEIFPAGRQNVICSWVAGYRAQGTATIPAPAGNATTATVGVGDLLFGSSQPTDIGFPMLTGSIVSADGATTFTAVQPGANLPAADQFTFVEGVWTFNAADANTPVVVTFDYAPADIEQGCIEMVGIVLKGRDNLGVRSKTLSGETVLFNSGAMSANVKEHLRPYRRFAPL